MSNINESSHMFTRAKLAPPCTNVRVPTVLYVVLVHTHSFGISPTMLTAHLCSNIARKEMSVVMATCSDKRDKCSGWLPPLPPHMLSMHTGGAAPVGYAPRANTWHECMYIHVSSCYSDSEKIVHFSNLEWLDWAVWAASHNTNPAHNACHKSW